MTAPPLLKPHCLLTLLLRQAQNHSSGLQEEPSDPGGGGGRRSGGRLVGQGHVSNPASAAIAAQRALIVCSFPRRCRAASRSTPLCSSWPAPRAASTCGSVLWRATPSSACASPPRGRPAAANSPGSARASGSGEREGDRRWLAQIPAIRERSVSHDPQPLYLWLLCIYGYIDQPPPPPLSCSNRESYCFLRDYYQRWSKQSRALQGRCVVCGSS